jgi:hypothetical protein
MKVPVLILFLLLSFTIKGVTSEPESTHTSNQSIDRLIQNILKYSYSPCHTFSSFYFSNNNQTQKLLYTKMIITIKLISV